MFKCNRTVKLPTTDREFEALVSRIMGVYKLESRQHTAAIIAGTIMHLPPHQAYCKMDFLGHSVLKNLAYQLARNKSNLIQHEMSINMLESNLVASPGDAQSMDALEKAAREGSEAARAALDRIAGRPENVVNLN